MSMDRIRLGVVTALFKAGRAFKRRDTMSAPAAPAGTIYSFELKTIDGAPKKLSDYKGQVLLLVNVASKCGLTPQYEGLEKLHKELAAKGLRVLGFPANEFGAQEPGTEAEIKGFCSTKYGVSFDMFSKIVVKGAGIHPLYKYLTQRAGHDGEISWNFEKFLVSRDGRVAARFDPETDPHDKRLLAALGELLG